MEARVFGIVVIPTRGLGTFVIPAAAGIQVSFGDDR
jgi:hypothetical protein